LESKEFERQLAELDLDEDYDSRKKPEKGSRNNPVGFMG
jgi:hypothetical protein